MSTFNNLKPNFLNTFARSRSFTSLRWKLVLPLLLVVLVFAMIATYALSDGITRGLRQSQINQLLLSSRAVSERAVAFGDSQRRELTRIAYTQGVPEALAANDGATLQRLVQPLAAAAKLDYLILGAADSHEVIGLQHSGSGNGMGYSVTQSAVLKGLPFVAEVLKGAQVSASGVVHTTSGYVLMTAYPVKRGNTLIGVAVAGVLLNHAGDALRGSDQMQIVLYGPNGEMLYSSMNALTKALAVSSTTLKLALYTTDQVQVQSLSVGGASYYTSYIPFVIDAVPLGVLGVFEPNTLLYASESSRNLLSLAFSTLAAGVVLSAFGLMSVGLRRLEAVTKVMRALALGDPYARTQMSATDEIGELGRALDVYARRTQKTQDTLQASLRQQRRETTRLNAVLESIPDGVVVQDLDGRVLLMNPAARSLLGSQRAFRNSPLNELTAIVTDKLGASLAPGVYSLGDPQRVPMDGKILHAQAAAVFAIEEKKRIGTVIVLRDVTDEVRRELARDALLEELSRDARAPILLSPGRPEDALHTFLQEVNRNAIALQRLIGEIRDLSATDAAGVKSGQRAIPIEPMLWNLASEWQPTAAANRIELHLLILRRDLYILGDERRLRWGIGNLIDNAIKYTPAGGHVTLMLCGDDDDRSAQFSIKDTGVGILAADQPHIFTRFYRGKPTGTDGKLIQTPGTGQGLFIARRVIEAHGGTLAIRSEAHHGTEVSFALPLTANVTLDMSTHAEIVRT